MEFLDKDTQIEYREKLLALFSSFIQFCDEYSLNYFCTGGTMLGAVRHHGFIPWDDDIDLFVMREDYNKLIGLKSELAKRNIGLEGLQLENSFAVFLKIWDMNTTLWEIDEIPYVYGVYIDIFPLDYTDDTEEMFLKKYKKRRFLFNLYQLSQIKFTPKSLMSRIRQKDYKFVARDILSLFVPPFLKNTIRKRFLLEDEKGQKEDGKYLASYYGDYWEREYLKREWFEDALIVDFESLKVKIPTGYDGYLSRIYHDYMQLPPKDKQVSHHYHYFLDLGRHYTLDQVKQMVK